MESAKQGQDAASRKDRFPTEWALDYGDEDDPVQPAQQRVGARFEGRTSDHDEEWAPVSHLSTQFG